jgi:hypothetical protein
VGGHSGSISVNAICGIWRELELPDNSYQIEKARNLAAQSCESFTKKNSLLLVQHHYARKSLA